MNVFELIHREHKISKFDYISLGFVSAASNVMVLTVINLATESTTKKQGTILYFVLFCLILMLYIVSQRRLMTKATVHVEVALNKLRCNLVTLVRHSELSTIEKIGRERIYTILSKELQTISQSSHLLVVVGQSSVLTVLTAAYVAWLSPTAFFIVITFIGSGAFIYLTRTNKIKAQLKATFRHDNMVIKLIASLLDGFKEVKLNRNRAAELQASINKNSDEMTVVRSTTQALYATDYIISQISFYCAIGATVFLAPILSETYPEDITKVTVATLFLIGPISNIVGGIPTFINANAAAQNIVDLENQLASAKNEIYDVDPIENFEELSIDGACYKHAAAEGDAPFSVGPVNLTIKRGQTIFITGSNGSGKTTFLRLLTGLYTPSEGQIRVDGRRIDDRNIEAYRNMFSTVFADYHLFKYLYGIPEDRLDEAAAYLKYVEMDKKVELYNNEYSTVDLSSGQKKRLALVSCALEHRPICIFDEWAADQDPYFRKKFYTEILPKLKDENRTIIAITHDEKYFDYADVHLAMHDGKLTHVKG
jgi:putative ATP-binding cassette transporter